MLIIQENQVGCIVLCALKYDSYNIEAILIILYQMGDYVALTKHLPAVIGHI